VLLCNLDIDNFFQISFLAALAKHVTEEVITAQMIVRSDSEDKREQLFDAIVGVPIIGRGEAGTTGRIAVFAHDFCKIGGHDEKCIGVGYQDIDLLRRIEELVKKQATGWPVLAQIRQNRAAMKTPVASGCGTCLLNFDGDSGEILTKAQGDARRKRDRGDAKLTQVDPEVVRTHQTWANMNAENVAVMKERLNLGMIVRNNMGHDLPKWDRTPSEHLQAFFVHDIGACRHEQG
jgi:hypothetical protein